MQGITLYLMNKKAQFFHITKASFLYYHAVVLWGLKNQINTVLGSHEMSKLANLPQ